MALIASPLLAQSGANSHNTRSRVPIGREQCVQLRGSRDFVVLIRGGKNTDTGV